MKKLVKLVPILVLIALLTSCSSDDSGSPAGFAVLDSPMANEAYDASNFGIYKGVFVGSSGIILINLSNDGEVSARLILDGNAYDFTVAQNVTQGEAINALTFTCDDMSFDFYVNADGTNAYVADPLFPDHPDATIQVVKEYSDQLVACYQGLFNGTDSGVINFIITDNQVYGLTKSDNSNEVFYLTGAIDGNNVAGIFDNGTFTGTKSGNTISGLLVNDEENNGGSITAKRKL